MSTAVLQHYPDFKEERMLFFVGLDRTDIEERFDLDLSDLCNCEHAQFSVKLQASDQYSHRGILIKKIKAKCLKCGKEMDFNRRGNRPIVDNSIF